MIKKNRKRYYWHNIYVKVNTAAIGVHVGDGKGLITLGWLWRIIGVLLTSQASIRHRRKDVEISNSLAHLLLCEAILMLNGSLIE